MLSWRWIATISFFLHDGSTQSFVNSLELFLISFLLSFWTIISQQQHLHQAGWQSVRQSNWSQLSDWAIINLSWYPLNLFPFHFLCSVRRRRVIVSVVSPSTCELTRSPQSSHFAKGNQNNPIELNVNLCETASSHDLMVKDGIKIRLTRPQWPSSRIAKTLMDHGWLNGMFAF